MARLLGFPPPTDCTYRTAHRGLRWGCAVLEGEVEPQRLVAMGQSATLIPVRFLTMLGHFLAGLTFFFSRVRRRPSHRERSLGVLVPDRRALRAAA